MEGPDRAIWFAGDLGDPWVVSIAESLPRESPRFDCPGDLPEVWPIDRPSPFALVVHRSTLSSTDAHRLARLKARADRTPRIVLCVGPYARYADVERWARLVDVVMPEATAREIVLRSALAIERKPRPSGGARPRVVVVSSNHDLRATLVEAARTGGFSVEGVSEPVEATPGVAVVWDVPVLEPDWPERLAALSRKSSVLALLGFADRATVTLARSQGAFACLDLPCDIGDLLHTLDRMTSARHDTPHATPPAPAAIRANLVRKH